MKHQNHNLVLRPYLGEVGRSPDVDLATTVPNCDQIATKPQTTGRDQCPTRTTHMPTVQEKCVLGGNRRTGGSGQYMTTDLAVGGSNPSRRAPTLWQLLGELQTVAHGEWATYRSGKRVGSWPRCCRGHPAGGLIVQ
jgi:hypothetical protein